MTVFVKVAIVTQGRVGPVCRPLAHAYLAFLGASERFQAQLCEDRIDGLRFLKGHAGPKWLIIFDGLSPAEPLRDMPVELRRDVHVMICIPVATHDVHDAAQLPVTKEVFAEGRPIVILGDDAILSGPALVDTLLLAA